MRTARPAALLGPDRPVPRPVEASEPPEPTLRFLAARGLPAFAREGVIPVALFYAGWKLGGLGVGVALATAAALAALGWEWRAGRRGTLAKLSLGLVCIQAATALIAHSETVYLAQPVLVSAAWGIAFLCSAAIGRPLAAVFAQPWYPFPEAFRATPAFRRRVRRRIGRLGHLPARAERAPARRAAPRRRRGLLPRPARPPARLRSPC